MNKEDFTNFLQTEEGKTTIAEMGLVDQSTLTETVKEKTTGLLNKRDELLEKLVASNKYKEKSNKMQNILDNYGLNSYDELNDLLDRVKNPNEPEDQRQLRNDFIKVKAEYEKIKNDYEVVNTQNGKTEEEYKKLLVDTQVKTSLIALGCNELQAEATSNYILNNNKFDVITESNGRKAITESGLTPKEFMIEWAKSEESKSFIPAKQSSGSNALGSSSHQQVVNVNKIISNAAKQGDTLSAIQVIDSQHQN